jgi:amino acid permease
MNKKTKRILALIGVILLVILFVATFLLAIFASPKSMGLFKAAFYSTIIIPILLYAYVLVYKHVKNNNNDDTQ